MNAIHKIHHELIIAISLSCLFVELSLGPYEPTEGILGCLSTL